MIDITDIEAARARLEADDDLVKWTPVEYSRSLSEATGSKAYLKMEHLQWTGSFKTRGAYNKVAQLATEDEISAVVAASAGNHAQGIALAAQRLGVDAKIVMPITAQQTKIDATEGYGAEVVLHGRSFQAAMRHARSLVADSDAAFVHAYDDPAIIAGQGTLGLEMLDDRPAVDTVVVPIGGGGLISGIATAFAHHAPDVRVVGVQPDGAATVPDSLQKGRPTTLEGVDTIADGIATGGISQRTYDHIDAYVDEVVTVSDDDISQAVLFLGERAKQVVEGAGAASVAAVLSGKVDVAEEEVLLLLSGGNLDMSTFRAILKYALVDREQLVRLRVRIHDEPGKMSEISGVISELGANIQTVRHERGIHDLRVAEAYLDFDLETTGHEQTRRIQRALLNEGYEVTRLDRSLPG